MKPDILYNEFHIDFSRPFAEQIDNLTEDLLQMKLGIDRLLDVGWYPEFDPNGHFIIQVIRNANWLSPEFYVSAQNEAELRSAVVNCICRAGGMPPPTKLDDCLT